MSTVLLSVIGVAYTSELLTQRNYPTGYQSGIDTDTQKERREIDKMIAEIRQIRSETSGSLFWLRLIGVFVTVGGAVGGYFISQKETTRDRLDFEKLKEQKRLDFELRKDVDAAYQAIIQELTIPDRPLLRASAAMKLGSLLQAFPREWESNAQREEDNQLRRQQLIRLTKQILATALALDESPDVRKALSIAIVMHPHQDGCDLQELNLSRVQASHAYWARADFTYADFYQSNLEGASFRKAILIGAQFWEANLEGAVLAEAVCTKTNFKFSNLRNTNFSNADLENANFQNADIQGADFRGARNMSVQQIQCANNWAEAIYDREFQILPTESHS
ncbi:MAG: pentapeptide repeat-containing protein [Elainellaceae cyanobacterium]